MCSADERNRYAGIDIRNNGYETSHEGWSGYQEVVFPLSVRFALTVARMGYLVAVLVVLDRWVPLDAVVRAQLLLLRAVLRSITEGIRRNSNQACKDSHGIGANVVPRTFGGRCCASHVACCLLHVGRCAAACWLFSVASCVMSVGLLAFARFMRFGAQRVLIHAVLRSGLGSACVRSIEISVRVIAVMGKKSRS